MRDKNARKKSRKKPLDQDGDEELTRYQRWHKRAKGMMDERLSNESKSEIVLKFFAGPIVAVLGVVVLYIILSFDDFTHIGGLMLAYFFPPAGKESVIPTGVFLFDLDPILVALSIAFVDIFIAIFLVWNYDFAKLIPFLGPWMEKIEKKGESQFEEHPWMEHLAFFGLVLFVMFPFQGSGAIGTSIIGRMIGMHKTKVFFAILIGAVVGCLLIAYFSSFFISLFKHNLYLTLGLLIIIAAALGIFVAHKFLIKKEIR
ncbi:small multi-drug export protein [[Eubacterium] cellulosolvens]